VQVQELQPKDQDQNFEAKPNHQKVMVIREKQG
jgi:hypothetical protein